jgi:iron-sulfur cluster repair protein YtfE (RIC family)
MAKKSYQVINTINTKLMQLEWVKKKLKWNFYELNKFWIYFFIHKNHFYNISLFTKLLDWAHNYQKVQGPKHKFQD